MATSFAVIGDIIGSREVEDRRALHDRLSAVLDDVNRDLAADRPLVVTVGDEFQGTYPRLGSALAATLLIRLALHPTADVRFGIGAGEITVLEESAERVVQDGPAWWAARRAIEDVRDEEQSATGRGVHTRYVEQSDNQSPDRVALVNALLVSRDLAVSKLSERATSILRDLLSDRSQTMVAEQLGISQSAVSQIAARDDLYAIRAAHRLAARVEGPR